MKKNMCGSGLADILNLFESADVIVVGDSPYLHSVDVADITGADENEVVRASWTDGEYDYSAIFTERGLRNGFWQGDAFFAHDHEGTETEIRFYKLQPMSPVAAKGTSELLSLVQEAAVPGGVGPYEFSRPGGWLDRAKAVLGKLVEGGVR